jgi:biotin synthase-like enzyme
MVALPENQSGGGRHKCAYCAYEQGFEDGLRRAAEIARQLILNEAGLKSSIT